MQLHDRQSKISNALAHAMERNVIHLPIYIMVCLSIQSNKNLPIKEHTVHTFKSIHTCALVSAFQERLYMVYLINSHGIISNVIPCCNEQPLRTNDGPIQ